MEITKRESLIFLCHSCDTYASSCNQVPRKLSILAKSFIAIAPPTKLPAFTSFVTSDQRISNIFYPRPYLLLPLVLAPCRLQTTAPARHAAPSCI
jgi:hypothetical protein